MPLVVAPQYQAVAGQGGITKLVMLPHESHGYRARESIMHTLAEQHEWLARWVIRQEAKPERKVEEEELEAAAAAAAQSQQAEWARVAWGLAAVSTLVWATLRAGRE